MRWILACLLSTAACAPPLTEGAGPGESGACVAAVAAHVSRPATEVEVVSTAPGQVTVRDGDRVHVCRMEGAAVREIVHPRGDAT